MVVFPEKNLKDQALTAKAWPFEEARKLLARIQKRGADAKPVEQVLFETGYGPSGLPHIGTFGEVARTSWVRHAFETLSDIPTRLIAFSDDMDGLRKVPDNLPQPQMLAAHLGQPLTSVPDPFGTADSFGHNMNARLRAFLDHFGFRYEFYSSTETYKSGLFDAALLRILANYDKVMAVMLPTLGEERQETYSPFLPVSPRSGKVLLAKVVRHDVAKGTITYLEEDGSEETVPVTGGHCKLQWKPDMGMRWAALGVDYEMYGKDHLTSAKLYDAICRIAGGTPPEQFMFELFLDDQGQKISKSKGNGISVEHWAVGKPVTIHVPEAAHGQAALFRRHPQGGRRIYRLPGCLSRGGNHRRTKAGKSRLAYPWRQGAGGKISGQLCFAAQSCVGVERP